jgi:hypothetical protein
MLPTRACVPLVPVVKTSRQSPPIFSRSSFACRSSSSGPFLPPLRLAYVCVRMDGWMDERTDGWIYESIRWVVG